MAVPPDYWFPKMTGRKLSEGLSRLHLALMFVGFNATFLPLCWLGTLGMRRRVVDSPAWMDQVQTFATVARLVIAASVLVFLYNIVRSLKRGEEAGENPWEAKTLEWTAPSPPPHGNFRAPPMVTEEPYDFGVPA